MHRLLVIIACCASVVPSFSQSKKQKPEKEAKQVTIFTVNKMPVSADEFIYLYRKNHQATQDEFTKENILEYLELYTNFKLKVEEARHRGMDTTQAFKKEFTGYRDELLKPYLPESKIIDSLVKLTYERMKEEVRASHLLIALKENASPADTLAAYNRIMEIRKKALSDEDFGSLAVAYSEDPSAKGNRGDLGYFTAFQMVHPFETAAYGTPVGQVSPPVKTRYGYHLIKVTDRKPARGEVEVSHIMIRGGNESGEEKAKDVAFEVFDQLRSGASWEELCLQYSEDPGSKNNGGRLRAFGVGAMAAVPEFEQMAFALEEPGDISDPFKTAYGWHIIRLEKKIPLPSLEELTPTLKNRVARDERLQISKGAWKTKFKKEFGFTEKKDVKTKVLAVADSALVNGDWDVSVGREILFTLQEKPSTAVEFFAYARKNHRPASGSGQSPAMQLYENYVETKLMELLAAKIANQNPEFKFLVNEYYEGILLFEIMEKEVWNKAAQDSTGLKEFFIRNRSKFLAGERVRADIYSAASADLIEPLRKLAQGNDSVQALEYSRNNKLKHESGLYEKEERTILSQVNWAEGVYSAEKDGMHYIVWVHQILPPGQRTFEEAKASAVADYQQELEKTWLIALRKKYPVKVNEKGKRYILDKLQK